MYKYYTKQKGILHGYLHKLVLIMRLTTVILIATIMQVSATGFAQKISLSKTNAPLINILTELRTQSGYDFVYKEKYLEISKPVNIKVNGAAIEEVLKLVFKNQPLTYKIQEKTVVITLKQVSLLDKVISAINDITVKGRVMDENSMPMPGVTVTIKGTSRRTSTDKNGLFEIRAEKPDDVLVFSSIGMETREININNRTELIVSLTSTNNSLQEVTVNTGYQTIQRQKMTGSAVTVTSAELEKRYQPNIIDNLEGRVPGLVNYRGTTQIRGVSTISDITDKGLLYVVDGLPITGSIANINPYDVESVTILKDASTSAIYGIRAANGVIVITTKKAKNKRTSVDFASDVSITRKPDLDYNLMSPAEQVDVESFYYNNQFLGSSATAYINALASDINKGLPVTPVQYGYYQVAKGVITQDQLQSQLDAFRNNNFRKQFKDNALLNTILQQYNLAIRSDGNKFQSSLVLNYKTNNNGIINSYNNELNIFYKGTYNLAKWIDVNFGVNGVLRKVKSSSSNFATSGTNVSPYIQLLDENGNRPMYTTSDYNLYNTTAASQPRYSMLVNHLDELDRDFSNAKQTSTRYFVNATATILPGLTFSPQFQYESVINNISAYSEPESYMMRYLKNAYSTRSSAGVYTSLLPENGGKLATNNSTGDSWTARGQLDYKKQIGKHDLQVIGGAEYRQTNTKGTSGLLLGYDDQLQSQSTTSVNFPSLVNYLTSTFKPGIGTATLYSNYIGNAIGVILDETHRFNSGYATASYAYDSKYVAFGSYRVDYADVFGLDKKYRGKPLWSVGLGWNISNESFMESMSWVNFLKLRASYGATGNIPLGVSSYLTANSTLINASTNLPASVVINAANPELRWEKTATTNVGLDFNLLNNRLTGTFDWYRKKGTDMFYEKLMSASEGFTRQIINNAGLVNDGLEVSLNYSWIKPGRKDGLGLSTLLILSHNKNKITYIDNVTVSPIPMVKTGDRVGDPVNSLYSLQYKGLNGVGQPQWLKADGTLTTVALTQPDIAAIVFSGGTDPKNNIALSNEVRYRGFSLNVLAVYYGGQYQRAQIPESYVSPRSGSMPSYILNSWTPDNTNTIIPGFGQYAPGTYPGSSAVPADHLAYSDAFVIAGDFIRIRNVVFGYQLPLSWAAKVGSKSVGLHFQLNNPKAIWVKNNINVDPETGGAPIPTSYVFGLNFSL